MKKQGAPVAIVVTAVSLISLLVATQSAFAATPNFPTLARGFTSWLVRAMDQCNASGLSVVGSGLPGAGCLQANTVTDNTLGMNFMKLRVSARGTVGLFGGGFVLGDSLRVRLTLRVTKGNTQVKHPPGSFKRVTYQDTTVDCPKPPDAFLARPNGAVVGRTDLAACLAPTSGLATGNIEILSATLINAATGQAVGVPGITR